jgi:acyl carrier protein
MGKSHKEKLTAFIQEELASGDQEIVPNIPLFEERIIDSMNILDLISFIEEERGAEIPDEQVVMKNFRSVETMANVFLSGYDG